MMISTRGRYALRVLIDIAENSNGNYIPLNDIASRQDISEKYLESILVLLTRGNLLNGLRGKGGGYKLTKAPEEYTMKSILTITEGTLAPVACLKDGAEPCLKSSSCKTLSVWQGLNKTITDYLESVTLADIIEKPDNYSI
ncbi:MAG: Rrf2 family transcriptional regulator [Clostridia bacterium]|nr:Rrf2 family transcriptional regulator [Clostridia bacterium]